VVFELVLGVTAERIGIDVLQLMAVICLGQAIIPNTFNLQKDFHHPIYSTLQLELNELASVGE
jgi:hypothetical protein